MDVLSPVLGDSQQSPFTLHNLLLLRQRNRLACYNFVGLGIENPHYLFMIHTVERMRLRPRVQFFQPLSDLPPRFRTIAMLTV
jgi:hypothetical protein